MRAFSWLAALALGLAAAGSSHAQQSSTTTANSTRLAPGNSGTASFLSSPFRIREAFHNFFNPISTRTPAGVTTIPDPNSKAYMDAFGFKKLF